MSYQDYAQEFGSFDAWPSARCSVEDKAGGYVAFRAGSFSTLNPYAALNMPLTQGIAARITAEYQSNESWIDKVKAIAGLLVPVVELLSKPAKFTWEEAITSEKASVSDDYDRGRRDGLRLALSILAAEEAKWAARLGESQSWRTNATREVRHKTLQVAQKRVQTALNRLTSKSDMSSASELASALEKIGF